MKANILKLTALTQVIIAAFVYHKDTDKLYVTPDGNCFLPDAKGHAINHGILIGEKVQEVDRKDYEDQITAKQDEITSKATAEAETTKESITVAKETETVSTEASEAKADESTDEGKPTKSKK